MKNRIVYITYDQNDNLHIRITDNKNKRNLYFSITESSALRLHRLQYRFRSCRFFYGDNCIQLKLFEYYKGE